MSGQIWCAYVFRILIRNDLFQCNQVFF